MTEPHRTMANDGAAAETAKPGVVKFDRWVGIFFLVVCAGLFYETFFFRTFDWDPVGMAFWPRVLLGVLAVVSVWHIVAGNAGGQPMEAFTRRAFVPFIGGMAYVLLLDPLGFFILTPIAILLYSLWLRPFSGKALLTAACLGIAGTAVIYLIFEFGMNIYLPRGILE